MSFDPVCGPGSYAYVYIRSVVSTYFTSLAAFCSSLLTTILSFVDALAVQVHSLCCPVCHYRLRHHHLNEGNREEEKKTALVFDCGTKTYKLERHDYIDVEKSPHRRSIPASAQLIKVSTPEGTKFLAEVLMDLPVKGFYIVGERPGTQPRMMDKDAQEDQPVELPYNQKELPAVPSSPPIPLAELPANEEPRRLAQLASQPVQRTSKSIPLLASPQPPSPKTRRKNPRLVPPKDGASMRSSTPELAWPQPPSPTTHPKSPRLVPPKDDVLERSLTPELALPQPPSPTTHQKNSQLVPPKDGASKRDSTPEVASPQPPSPTTHPNNSQLAPPKDDALERSISKGLSMNSRSIKIGFWQIEQYDSEKEDLKPLQDSTPSPRPFSWQTPLY